MSGIAGIVYRDGRPAEQEFIEAMVGAMEHRGPDGIHTWREGSVALGHCMLHTTPEAVYDNLPMESRDGNLVMTADARIDNREELIRALRLKPYRDAPLTDCDLILAAYQKWGEACPGHLLGAFAFVIWDKREQRLFCARDHFGVKPLYWSRDDRCVAFASEVVGLLKIARGESMALDPVTIAHHLGVPVEGVSERTGYKAIRRIEPGNSVTCVRDSTTAQRYYTLEAGASSESSPDTDIIDRFKALFNDSVDVRLRNSGRTGGMLSGGLDSTSIVASAIRDDGEGADDGRFPVFSAVFGTTAKSDESVYIKSVLDRYPQLSSYICDANKVDAYRTISNIIEDSKILITGGNIYINDSLYRYAGKNGVGVVLSGFDGDTTVSHGREYLNELRNTGRIAKLSKELYYVAKVSEMPYWKILNNWLRGPVLELPGVRLARGLYRRIKHRASDDRMEDKPTWKKIAHPDLLNSVQDYLSENCDVLPDVAKTQQERHREQVLRPEMVETLELLDVVAARHRVEIRYPFFDKRLIEFCLNVPGNLKIRRGWTRYILREAMRDRLPVEIYKRRNKGNLAYALDHNFRESAAESVVALLPESKPNLNDFVNVEHTRRVIENYSAGAVGSGNQHGNLVVRLLLLEHWLSSQKNAGGRTSI